MVEDQQLYRPFLKSSVSLHTQVVDPFPIVRKSRSVQLPQNSQIHRERAPLQRRDYVRLDDTNLTPPTEESPLLKSTSNDTLCTISNEDLKPHFSTDNPEHKETSLTKKLSIRRQLTRAKSLTKHFKTKSTDNSDSAVNSLKKIFGRTIIANESHLAYPHENYGLQPAKPRELIMLSEDIDLEHAALLQNLKPSNAVWPNNPRIAIRNEVWKLF
ncbi:hypothetical protein HK098_003156 [Nowakowskiella sp. JEL0407]|nr:hypothetical protein HK098_003156 [Nowakowskiella sp. JEL0407]